MQVEKQWYALYTKPHQEKKVVDFLTRKRVECFSPVTRGTTRPGDRRKPMPHPVFSSYVFVRSSTNDLCTMLPIDGVVQFVYWLGSPAIISNEEITALRELSLGIKV